MRRTVLLGLLVALALALAAGCGGSKKAHGGGDGSGQGAASTAEGSTGAGTGNEAESTTLTIGWLFPSAPDDAAVEALEQAFPKRVLVLAAENAGTPEDRAQRAQALVDQGAAFLVGAGIGFCEANPEVHCVDVGPLADAPANVALYVPAAWEQEYVLGFAAGLVTESDSTAFIARSRTPEDIARVNGWALGCQAANPNCLTRVLWLDETDPAPVTVAESLPNRIDVLRSVVDDSRLCELGKLAKPWLSAGPETTETCPQRVVAAPVVDLATIVIAEIEQELTGSWSGGRVEIVGLPEGAGLTPLGPRVPADVQQRVDQAAGEIAGGQSPFFGPLYDNQGQERVPEGETLTEEFLASQWDWLLGGVLEQ